MKKTENEIQIFNTKIDIMDWQRANCHQCLKELQCELKNDIDNNFPSGETSFETADKIGIHASYKASQWEANIQCEQILKME